MQPATKRRIFELDLLRGLFIVIIIIDHLQFWPSPFTYLTGEGRLWVNAAEGFFIISGLLIGYIRGYKGKNQPLKKLTKLLVARGLLLYVWGVAITLIITAFALWIGGHPLLPKLPTPEQLTSPMSFIWSVLTMQYFNDWIYFLRLYAIMLIATPLFLWLLRHGYERILPLIIVLVYGVSFVVPEYALQWQALFFGAALIGYRLEDIASWFRKRPKVKRVTTYTVASVTLITMCLSYFFVHGWHIVENPNSHLGRDTYVAVRTVIDPYFTNYPLAPARIALSFVWFSGILLTVHAFRKWILKGLGWLLIPLGERSLSAYCLQALLLPLVVTTIAVSTSPWVNALVAIAVVLGIWWLLRQKFIQKIIPR